MCYKFYREHKYISSRLNDLERLVVKTDFRNQDEVIEVSNSFNAIGTLLKNHAHYEDTALHTFIRYSKQSTRSYTNRAKQTMTSLSKSSIHYKICSIK